MNAIKAPYQREPRENQIERLVYQLDVDPELAHECVARAIDVVEVHRTVHCREERPVEPTPTLGNQLRDFVWHICYRVCGFDIVEDPGCAPL